MEIPNTPIDIIDCLSGNMNIENLRSILRPTERLNRSPRWTLIKKLITQWAESSAPKPRGCARTSTEGLDAKRSPTDQWLPFDRQRSDSAAPPSSWRVDKEAQRAGMRLRPVHETTLFPIENPPFTTPRCRVAMWSGPAEEACQSGRSPRPSDLPPLRERIARCDATSRRCVSPDNFSPRCSLFMSSRTSNRDTKSLSNLTCVHVTKTWHCQVLGRSKARTEVSRLLLRVILEHQNVLS